MINKEFKETNISSINIQCTSNNTIVSLIDPEGSLVTTLSSGHLNYKGSRKGTQIASQQVIFSLGEKALMLGYTRFIVRIKGIGKGRNSAIKELKKVGLGLEKVIDITPLPYNGCRVAKGKK
jgi:small subunit ribosomal protein S11